MFSFKKFVVKQNQTAMKIGTDGVLLSAWTPLENNPFSILDIGTGTGIIALMLAQRSELESRQTQTVTPGLMCTMIVDQTLRRQPLSNLVLSIHS